VSVAHFVAAQRTDHGIPHALSCRALSLSASWFYKWRDRAPTLRQQRRKALDVEVRASFETSGGRYGSPRVLADLRAEGWRVAKKSVEASMSRQRLVARPKRRRRCLTRPDKAAPRIPDLVKRDFTAPSVNLRWCGDLTEVPTGEGKLYLATVEDLASRRIVGFGLSEHHDTELATAALKMAVAVRGGRVAGTVFHSDRGGEYHGELFATACATLAITQSMGRAGSCLLTG
jgi:transposase InsO family protein